MTVYRSDLKKKLICRCRGYRYGNLCLICRAKCFLNTTRNQLGKTFTYQISDNAIIYNSPIRIKYGETLIAINEFNLNCFPGFCWLIKHYILKRIYLCSWESLASPCNKDNVENHHRDDIMTFLYQPLCFQIHSTFIQPTSNYQNSKQELNNFAKLRFQYINLCEIQNVGKTPTNPVELLKYLNQLSS